MFKSECVPGQTTSAGGTDQVGHEQLDHPKGDHPEGEFHDGQHYREDHVIPFKRVPVHDRVDQNQQLYHCVHS